MEAILDGSFMLNAMRNKIDFISQLENEGFKVVVPREVMQEMKDLREKAKTPDRVLIDLIFQMVEQRDVKKIGLGKDRVDLQLIKLGKAGKYIATTDAAIKRSVKNRIGINIAGKKIIVERD